MQMFKKSVNIAHQGDRVGICVTQFDAKQLERGLISSPDHLCSSYAVIAKVHKINYFKGKCNTKAKFHVTILHETVLASLTFFGGHANEMIDFNSDYEFLEELNNPDDENRSNFCLIEFQHPVIINQNSLLIGSKLDSDIHANSCRLAFYGNAQHLLTDKDYHNSVLPDLKIYKIKTREGTVERVVNDYEVIGVQMFKKETNIQNFVGLKVKLSTGEDGIIDGSFGKSGKFKVRIPGGLKNEFCKDDVKIVLYFKRYIYDKNKKMIQT